MTCIHYTHRLCNHFHSPEDTTTEKRLPASKDGCSHLTDWSQSVSFFPRSPWSKLFLPLRCFPCFLPFSCVINSSDWWRGPLWFSPSLLSNAPLSSSPIHFLVPGRRFSCGGKGRATLAPKTQPVDARHRVHGWPGLWMSCLWHLAGNGADVCSVMKDLMMDILLRAWERALLLGAEIFDASTLWSWKKHSWKRKSSILLGF